MANITVSLPSDGDSIVAANYNTPVNTIVNEINGKLDNSNIASGAAIDGAKLADDSVTANKLDLATLYSAGVWWEELGRTTLGSSSTSITVSSLPNRRYLKVVMGLYGKSGTFQVGIRFNGDTGNNYAWRRNRNDDAAETDNSVSFIAISPTNYQENKGLAIMYIENMTGRSKVMSCDLVSTNANPTNVPYKDISLGQWSDNSAISSITIFNANNSNTFNSNTEVVVLGHN